MHAFLITGSTKENRLKKIETLIRTDNVSPFDQRRLVMDEEAQSLGISNVRSWQKQLLLMPQSSPYTAGIIEGAELLTQEAQNAILKTLEEPPKHTQIYLEAPTDAALLPTIISRCQTVHLPATANEMSKLETEIAERIQSMQTHPPTMGAALQQVDGLDIKTKSDAETWVETALSALQKTRTQWTPTQFATYSMRLFDAKKQLAANVSFKLVLDHVFLAFTTRQS